MRNVNSHVIHQINLHHCKAAMANISQMLLRKGQTSICLIQEPYAYKGKVKGLGEVGEIHYVRNLGSNPRACIVTSNDVKATLLSNFCRRDLVAVLTEWKQGKVVYASVYMPYEEVCPPQGVDELVQYCRVKGLPLILGCDSNAHHTMWGSSNINARGSTLCEYIAGTDLSCINKGHKPTFVVSNRQERIDITLASPSVIGNVKKWWVDDEPSLSDHCFIRMKVQLGPPEPMYYRNKKKTNWTLYSETVSENIKCMDNMDISSEEEIDMAVDLLTTILVEGFHEACPLKKVVPKKRIVPYWTRELTLLRKDSRGRWRDHMRLKTEESWASYCVSRNSYSAALRHAKRGSWREYCETVESASESARLYRILKDDQVSRLGLLEDGGVYTKDLKGSLNLLLCKHFPSDPKGAEGEMEQVVEDNSSEVEEIVTPELVMKAVGKLKPYKAAGRDEIFPMMLRKVNLAISGVLVKVMRACLCKGYTPLQWREMKVVFLPKPGKESYEKVNAWRPISLTSFLLKTLERLIDWHLRTPDLIQRLRGNNQFAYIKGVSTEAALHQLVARAEGALKSSEYAIGIFLDIKGAFSESTFRSLEKGMKGFNISLTCARFFRTC
jgi:hypothetical protein